MNIGLLHNFYHQLVRCALLLFLFFSALHAADGSAVVLDTISVADYFEQFDKPQMTTIVEKEAWQGKVASLADVLEDQAGIQTRKYGGLGAFQTIWLRGQGSSRVVVCMDGIPMNSASGSSVDLGKIDLSGIEKIEIYKSFIPARFGVSSVGGLINLVTKKKQKRSWYLDATYGSFNTHLHSVSTTQPVASGIVSQSIVSYKHSDNDFKYLDRKRTDLTALDDEVRKRRNDDYDAVHLFEKLTVTHDAGIFEFRLDGNWDKKGFPGLEDGNASKSKQETYQALAGMRYDHQWLSSWYPQMSMGVEYKAKQIDLSVYKVDFPSVPSDLELEIQLQQIAMPINVQMLFGEKVMVNIPILGVWENIKPENLGDALSGIAYNNSRMRMSKGLEGTWFVNGSLELLVRYLSEHQIDNSSNDTISTLYDHFQSYSGGFNYKPVDQSDMKLSFVGNIGTNFQFPSLEDKYGIKDAVLGNKDLKTEYSFEQEIGARFVYKKWYIEVLYFNKTIYDWIVTKYSQGFRRSENEEKVHNHGAEISTRVDLFNHIKNRLNITLQNSENRANISSDYGKKLPYTPLISIANHIEFYCSWFKLSYDIQYQSSLYRDPANGWRSKAKYTHDLFLKIPIPIQKQWSVLLGVEDITSNNIADEGVNDSYPSPGRRLSLNTTLHL